MTGQYHGGVLNLNDPADISNPECSFCDALKAKHPPAQPLRPKIFLSTPAVHPVVSDSLDATVVHAAALCTVGTVEPFWIAACG